MWTIFAEQPDPAAAVAERDEIFAQQPDAHRRTVGFGDLARQQRRDPVASHRLALRCPRSGSAAHFPRVTAWDFLSPRTYRSSRLVALKRKPRRLTRTGRHETIERLRTCRGRRCLASTRDCRRAWHQEGTAQQIAVPWVARTPHGRVSDHKIAARCPNVPSDQIEC